MLASLFLMGRAFSCSGERFASVERRKKKEDLVRARIVWAHDKANNVEQKETCERSVRLVFLKASVVSGTEPRFRDALLLLDNATAACSDQA